MEWQSVTLRDLHTKTAGWRLLVRLKKQSWKTLSYSTIVATDTNKLFSAGEQKHVCGFCLDETTFITLCYCCCFLNKPLNGHYKHRYASVSGRRKWSTQFTAQLLCWVKVVAKFMHCTIWYNNHIICLPW